MNQILSQETLQSDEYYKQEVRRMLAEMQQKNEVMKRDQEEIDWLRGQSAQTMRQIQENLDRIEKVLT